MNAGGLLARWRHRETPPILGWDFHCHLLPGVDDGMRSLAESREAIAGLHALGYRGSVVTPHIYAEAFDNTAEGLREAFESFQEAIDDDYALRLAAEYHTTDVLFTLIEAGNLLHLPLGDERLVLTEFPFLMPAPRGIEALTALIQAGYRPVLAHVERYRYIQHDPEPWLEHLQALGVWLQCNVGSLAGMHGPASQVFARQLLQRELPVIWSTDLHRPMQIDRYIVPGLRQLGHLGRLNARLDALDVTTDTLT